MFLKNLYHTLIAFISSILFFLILTFTFHLIIKGYLGIDVLEKSKDPIYLSLYLILLSLYWSILLPFFSPHLSVFFSSQKKLIIKSMLVKIFVYLAIFSFLHIIQYDFLTKNYLKGQDKKIAKIIEFSKKDNLFAKNVKRQLQLSFHSQHFSFKNKQNAGIAIFIYSLYLLLILLFQKGADNYINHYLRNIGFSSVMLIIFFFLIAYF